MEDFPLEEIYYYYCFILNRSEEEFLKSSFSKVYWVVEKSIHRNNAEKEQEQEEVCSSMKQFLR